VDLVQVDVIGVQAAQAVLDGGADVGRVQAVVGAADPGHVHVRAGDLGGQDHFITAAALPEPAADEALGRALRVGTRHHRIHLGGVDEIDAAFKRIVELAVGFSLGVLLAEGHGAEAHF